MIHSECDGDDGTMKPVLVLQKRLLVGVRAHLLSLTDNACTVAGQGITEHVGSGAFRMWVDRSGGPSLTDTFTCILTY